jgi:hypothetical protein
MTFSDGKNIYHEARYDDGTVYGCDCDGIVVECIACDWAGCPMRSREVVVSSDD